MDILNLIIKILLIALLIAQLIVMVYMFFINHKRFQEDKKFWANLDEEIQLSKKRLQHYLDECPEEVCEDEQIGNQKQETGGSILGEGKTEDK